MNLQGSAELPDEIAHDAEKAELLAEGNNLSDETHQSGCED